MSKIEKLRKHLISGKAITGIGAMKLFSYYRLADGVHKLRKRGYDIKTVMVESKGVTHALYYIE
jgi:hypothetical protein